MLKEKIERDTREETNKKMKKVDEMIRVLGDKKADSLMISVDEAQARLDSAIDEIWDDQLIRAWEELKGAEEALLEAILLHNEFLVEKEKREEIEREK